MNADILEGKWEQLKGKAVSVHGKNKGFQASLRSNGN